MYNLNVSSFNLGGYFSSEQLDLLSIICCQTYEELIYFVHQCKQLAGVFSKDDFQSFFDYDLESLKRKIFKSYQDTLVPHNSDKKIVLDNTLYRLGLKEEDIEVVKRLYTEKNVDSMKYISEYIKNKYPNNYEELFRQVHQFISIERDQNKSPNLYNELELINEELSIFDTFLVGSGKPEIVINDLFDKDNKDYFDFYFAERDLNFAQRSNKHVRFHSLLTKGACENLFNGRTREDVLESLAAYVKATIDFVNEYNSNHKLKDGTPVINSIDLFNEIVSFNRNSHGEYENIWESKYGITIQDICDVFAYAKEYKPEGVSYLYNEPFLEDTERRKKVLQVLQSINSVSEGLIDTLGSQMHITFGTSDEKIKEMFEDFKSLQDNQGMSIQITEFDLSLSEREVLKVIGDRPQFSYEQVYTFKKERIDSISSIINNSGIKLDGVSYWSLTDNIDCNLERVRTNLLSKGMISGIEQVPTVCGGLIPTSEQYVNAIPKGVDLNFSNSFKR